MKSPPTEPVRWLVLDRRTHTEVTLPTRHQTWYEAREAALQLLGCTPSDLMVSLLDNDD